MVTNGKEMSVLELCRVFVDGLSLCSVLSVYFIESLVRDFITKGSNKKKNQLLRVEWPHTINEMFIVKVRFLKLL